MVWTLFEFGFGVPFPAALPPASRGWQEAITRARPVSDLQAATRTSFR